MSSTTLTNASQTAAANVALARQVLIGTGTEEVFELFADDVVLEFPYGPSLGMPDRFEGKETAVTYLRQMLDQLTGLKMHDIHNYAVDGDPGTVFNEYKGDALTPGGNTYTQTYMSKMQFRDGKLTLLREFWNPMTVVEATSGAYDGNLED